MRNLLAIAVNAAIELTNTEGDFKSRHNPNAVISALLMELNGFLNK